MIRFLFLFIFAIEVFALANRGGGPLLSHFFLIGVTFLAVCAAVFLRRPEKFKAGLPELSYLGFFVLFVVSLFVSRTPGFGLAELLLFGSTGILFLLSANIPPSEKEIEWFSYGIIGIALIDTLIGYFIYLDTAFPRFTGTFVDLTAPYTSFGNDFPNFLLFVLPLSFWHLLRRHPRPTTTVIFTLITSVLLSGFLLSFSRGAWLSFLLIIIVVLIWVIIQKTRRFHSEAPLFAAPPILLSRVLAVAVLTSLLVAGLQTVRSQNFETNDFLKKILFREDEGTASVDNRVDYWKGAVNIIKERPLLGSGVLSFAYLNPRYQTSFEVNEQHPHNVFLKIGVENGLIAALLFALFLISTAVLLLRFLWKHPSHVVLPFLLGPLGSLAHNFIDYNFIVGNFVFFMVFLGLGVGYARTSLQAGKEMQRDFSYIALLMLSGALLGIGLWEAYYNQDFKTGRALMDEGKVVEAIPYLERAENLIFERDRVNYLAVAYVKNKEVEKAQKLLEKEKDSVDSFVASLLGEIYRDKGMNKEAKNAFEDALMLNPKNQFKYYFNLFETQKKLGEPIDPAIKEKVLKLLEDYKPILKENRHFTVTTENPKYAAKLYEFFGMKTDQEEIEFFYLREALKFFDKYGIPKPTLSI